jgi:hypothetical protein
MTLLGCCTCSLVDIILMMEKVTTSETSVSSYETTWRSISEAVIILPYEIRVETEGTELKVKLSRYAM